MLISSHSLNHHLYADNTQIFLSFRPPDFQSSPTHLQEVLQQISSWITANLQSLNSSKTDRISSRRTYPPIASVSHNVCCKWGGISPNSMSRSVPARDEIPTIFVRKFFRRTHASPIWLLMHL